MSWTNSATIELASAAAERWNATVERHIADSGNSVWLVRRAGEPFVLRLSDPAYRSIAESRAEIDFLDHLDTCGVQVATAIPSTEGSTVETIRSNDEEMLASLFRHAPGERVDPSSPHWNDDLFLEWGRTLGRIHAASRIYEPDGERRRWHWKDELFLAHASRLIPREDSETLRAFDDLIEWFDKLPRASETFGMTHGDFAPQNFHYHPEHGITAFDFGNCCYHWYISDVVVSLTVVRRHPERDRYRDLIFEGYREHGAIDPALLGNVAWFFRLRAFYVYMSRLMKFGPTPNEEERSILETLRRNVHLPFAW